MQAIRKHERYTKVLYRFLIFDYILAVNFVCDHPDIKAISFVGSNQAGEYIHERGSKNGKRVQSNMGAKNHGVVLPDANKENTLNQLVGAAFGAAGQRCMALSTAVFVGDAKDWIGELEERAKKLVVNAGKIKRKCLLFSMFNYPLPYY